MTVKDQVFNLMKNKEWVSVEDFERIFPVKTEGHQSYGQRMRSLREEGYTIIKRKKANCPHTWEFHLVLPESPVPDPVYFIKKQQLVFI